MRPLRAILIFSLIASVNGHKILVFSPTISRSHMISNGRIADELSKAGHEVVMFEPDFLNIFDKVNASKYARRWPVYGFSYALHQALQAFSGDIFSDENVFTINRAMEIYNAAYNKHCKEILDYPGLLDALKAEKFDAFFGEQINPCGNGIAEAIGIKIHFWISRQCSALNSFNFGCAIWESMQWALNMPIPMSYVPAVVGLGVDSKMSYMDRVRNVLYTIVNIYYNSKTYTDLDKIFREKFGPDFPELSYIAGSSDVVFVATDEFIEFPRPLLPNTVHIGGLGLTDKLSPLGEKFEAEMLKGDQGVIYFSLGSIVNTSVLPNCVMESIGSIAKNMPEYHFIIRADEHDDHAKKVADNVPNMAVYNWLPQPAILAHDRLKIFITHAGYNGIMEAARAGVPLLMLPFMFDQARNSYAVAHSHWGITLPRQLLRDDPKKIEEALRKMLSDNSYKKAALRIRRLIREKPFNASERLLAHTNFVLNNGGVKELLIEGRTHNFIKYFNLDIFVPFILIIIIIVYAVFFATKAILRSLRATRKLKKN